MDFKKMLFKEESVAVADPPAAAPRKTSVVATKRTAFTIATPVATTTEPNPEFAADIEKVLASDTIFVALQSQLALLEAAIPDEGVRLQTAIKSVVALTKATEQQIVMAVQKQLRALAEHEASFTRGLDTEVKQRTKQYEDHIADLTKQQEQNDNRLRAIQAEQERISTDLMDTQTQLSSIESEQEQVKQQFTDTFTIYQTRLQNIAAHLGIA